MSDILKTKKNALLLAVMVFCGGCNLLILGSFDRDVYIILAQTNFITVVPNLIVLSLIFNQLVSYNRISNLLIPRTGLSSYLTSQGLLSVGMGLLYLSTQYGLNMWVLVVKHPSHINIIYLYMLLNLLVFMIEIALMNLINFGVKPVIVFVLAIALNLAWHYAFVIYTISRLYSGG